MEDEILEIRTFYEQQWLSRVYPSSISASSVPRKRNGVSLTSKLKKTPIAVSGEMPEFKVYMFVR